MIRTSDDPMWWHTLDRRLAELVNVVVLGLIGWSLSGIQRPSAGRVAFWWFALMEFVLFSGRYTINKPEWQQWRASGILALILLALYTAAKRNGRDPFVPPAPPDLVSS